MQSIGTIVNVYVLSAGEFAAGAATMLSDTAKAVLCMLAACQAGSVKLCDRMIALRINFLDHLSCHSMATSMK